MKKIKNWFLNIDTLMLLLVMAMLLVVVYTLIDDVFVKAFYTIIGIPVALFLVQQVIMKRQTNVFYNIELYLKKQIDTGLVWKSLNSNPQEDICYLNIINTGKVDIFELYLRVATVDGSTGQYGIADLLNVQSEINICIPFKREKIKEVTVTCCFQTENKTKKFSGIQSGDNEKYIFAEVKKIEDKKQSVIYGTSYDVFEKMGRFLI